MTYRVFERAIVRGSPPWLQRTTGGKVLAAMGAEVDRLVERTVSAVKARFTNLETDTALGTTGRERLIRRGIGEPAASYAARLRRWRQDHRMRGNAYALLRQYHAFLRYFAPSQIDVISQSGLRHIADATTGEITRDQLADWEGDGTAAAAPVLLAANASPGDLELRPGTIVGFPPEGRYRLRLRTGATTEDVWGLGTSTSPYPRIVLEAPGVVGTYLAGPGSVQQVVAFWARLWVVVRLTGLVTTTLTTEDDDELLTEDEETLDGDVPPWVGAFDADDESVWTSVLRDWIPAHIQRAVVVLLFGDGRLWDYPIPVPTWDEWAATSNYDDDPPVVLTVES